MVERAADPLTVDHPAVPEMRTHVRAVGVRHHDPAAFGAIQHELATEVVERDDVALDHRRGLAEEVPPVGIGRERIPIRRLHQRSPFGLARESSQSRGRASVRDA